MMLVRIHPDVAPRPIHPQWQAKALTEIGNSTLREAILGNERFSGRIADHLIEAAFNRALPTRKAAKIEAGVARLLERLDDNFLTRIGQLWFAPILAARILAPTGRSDCGFDDRQSLRLVLNYRDHAAPAVIGSFPATPDYGREGAHCISAWLDRFFDPAVADRIRLTLAPDASPDCLTRPHRAALVDRILADTDICGD
jgi:hypothetical protein